MPKVNEIACATDMRNTGVGTCVVNPTKIVGAFKVPANFSIPDAFATTVSALRTYLTESTLKDSVLERIFPVHGFKGYTSSSEELVQATLGYGSQVPVRDGNYRWTFQFLDGGLCLLKALQSHNYQSSRWIFYDDQGLLIGWRRQLVTGGSYDLTGIPTTFHALKWDPSDGANPASYRLYFDFEPQYINKYLGFLQPGFNPAEILGLQDINLVQTGVSAAGVSKIQAKTGCDGSNLYDLTGFSAALASAALWTATNPVSGNAITISSVVADPNTKAFTVTLLNSDPDYPGSAGGEVVIGLVGPTELDAADISGYEGRPVTIVRG